jgi:16S rRNA (cytosine967-C5)-methyltransferase
LVRDLGDQAEAVARALSERAPMTIRVNRLKTSVEELAGALAERDIATHPSSLAPEALIFDTRLNLFALPEFKAGLFEAQDEGSQLIAELVMPPPKAMVVDLCAGAGGKTLALAAAMGGKGRLLATDIYKRKLDELRKRCRRAGASNVQAVLIERDPKAPWPAAMDKWLGKASRVLIDAPCSGVGSMRRNPELRWRLSADDVDRLPDEQLALCERALSLLAPGGRLIYATCTMLRDENERVVERLLERHSDLEAVPCKEVWGRDRALAVGDGQYLRTLPSLHGCDGFFAAIVRRKR